MKPRLLDLFCGAGGAAMGYHWAGFEVVGVDHLPQKNYPFEFVQADAMTYPLEGFDVIHASPPCQGYSKTRKILEGKGLVNRKAVDLIGALRQYLSGRLYVIENVPGAPLISPLMLCGAMFQLRVLRHRLFETSVLLLAPSHAAHTGGTNSHRGYSTGAEFVTVGGHNYNTAEGKLAMGIDWMTRDELNEAIPPVYTEYIGRQLMNVLKQGPQRSLRQLLPAGTR